MQSERKRNQIQNQPERQQGGKQNVTVVTNTCYVYVGEGRGGGLNTTDSD